MSDPFSPLASVITIAGGALESIRTLSTILRRFRKAPAQVYEWLAMLESLSSTLLSLQQCGGHLEARHHFSTNFQQRLQSCVNQLQRNISEIARIHAELVMRSPDTIKQLDYKVRRSWEKTKWAVIGDQKMKQVMKLVNMYHFEFVMELLRIVIVAQPTQRLPPSLPAVPRKNFPQQQRLRITKSEPELLRRRLARTNSCHAVEGPVAMPSAITRRDFLQAATMKDFPTMQSTGISPMDHFHTWVSAAVLLQWKLIACRFMLRVGPVMNMRLNNYLEAQSEKHQPKKHQQIGLGLIFSMYLPQRLGRPFGLALLNFHMSIISQTTQTLYWNLSLPKTVSPDAEIFNYTRAGSIHHVQRLLSLKRASASDITIFGTTLLHSAANSGHIQLTRLLIQEGADVNAQDEDGETPLHGAMARSGNYDVARTLIEHGADLSSRAVDGKTPFHNIFNDTIGSVLMRDDWLEHMNPDAEGMSISHFLAWSSWSSPETFQRGRLCDEADLQAVDGLGRTCLHFAASRGNLGVLSYLVSRVSQHDVDRRDDQGRTPFHYAVESNRAAGVIDILMKKRRNVHAPDDVGMERLELGGAMGGFHCNREADGDRWRGTPALDSEVRQTRAPALYRYLSHNMGVAFPLVVETAGLLVLIIMVLLGVPD